MPRGDGRRRVGGALGSGGAAHVGVLNVLDREGIPVRGSRATPVRCSETCGSRASKIPFAAAAT
ncbi:TPA: hypothetical protein EYP13_05475, partial [Candidatus Micrarchaeota archaeon]|nr:hypothetical protein [Candidatus Micrarchaeota archaeon]